VRAGGLAMLHIHHMNLQPLNGGGEVYTHAMTRAFAQAGASVSLYVHPSNRLWDDLARPGIERVEAEDEAAFLARLPTSRSLVVAQGPISRDCATALGERQSSPAAAPTASGARTWWPPCRATASTCCAPRV
jgi:hypothetical protein